MQKILIVIVFWVYGLRGAVVTGSFFVDTFLTVFLSIGFYFLFRSHDNSMPSVHITKALTTRFGVLLGVLILIVSTKLFYPLSFDQFYYSQQSIFHSIFILDSLNTIVNLELIHDLQYRIVVQILSLFIVIGLAIITIFSKSASLIFALFFFSVRFVTLALGGIQNTHPPLQLLPLLISSSILGIHEFSFRVTQIIPVAIIFWVSTKLSPVQNRLKSFLLSLSLSTFPLLLHAGTLVESSVYTSMSVFIVLSILYYRSRFSPNELLFLTLLVGITPLIRIPAFLGVIVLYSFYFFYEKEFLKKFAKYHLMITLAWIPYVTYSLLQGTPATNELEDTSLPFSLIQRIDVISNGIPEWYFFFLLMPLILAFKHSKEKTLIWGLYFLTGCLMFTSIRESLLYIDRYKVEYILPFVLFGYIMSINHVLASNRKILINSLTLLAILLTAVNITQFRSYTTNIEERLSEYALDISSPSILTEINYPYKDLLQEIKNRENLLVAGITYGVMPQVLSGWSVSEIFKTNATYLEAERDKNWSQFDVIDLNDKTTIEQVLITDGVSDELLFDLDDLGFELIDSTRFNPHGTTSYLYSKKHGQE